MDSSDNMVDELPQGSELLDQVAQLVESREDRPCWDEYFMSVALLISMRSACDRLKVGCVLVSSGKQSNRIIAAGYNGFLPGAPHASHVLPNAA